MMRRTAYVEPPPPEPALPPRRAPGKSRSVNARPAPQPDRHSSEGSSLRDLPSGLVSLIVHFSLLILLGLVVFPPKQGPLVELSLNWSDGDDIAGGGGGPDELGDAEVETPEEMLPTAESEIADPLTEELSEFADSPLEIDPTSMLEIEAPEIDASDAIADLNSMGDSKIRGAGSGGGTGGGKGRGNGTGTGDRNGPSSGTGMFGLRDEGSRIVFVFDRSDSMNSVFTLTSNGGSRSITPLEAAKTELMKSLNDLALGAEFQVVFYNNEPEMFAGSKAKEGITVASPETTAKAQSFVYDMVAQNDTNHVAALQMALKLNPDVIFLLTDGEAKDDLTNQQVKEFEKQARRSGTRINVIHFCYEPRTTTTLRKLADETGGQFKMILIRSLVDPDWRGGADEN